MLLLFSFALHLLRLALSANYMNAIGIFSLALRKCGNVPLATSSKNKHGKKSVTSVCVCMCVIFAYCLCLVGCVHLNAPMCVYVWQWYVLLLFHYKIEMQRVDFIRFS